MTRASDRITTDRWVKAVEIAAPAPFAFAWHERPGAFERLTPPWEPVRVVERHGSIRDGDRLVMEMGPRPLAMRWVAEHRGYEPGRRFRDVQVAGPFATWEHTHTVEPLGDTRSRLTDDIEYALPFGAVGRFVGGGFTRARLERMFRYRHAVTTGDIADHWRTRDAGSRRVLVSGSHGLIGGALVPYLTTGGHVVTRLARVPTPGAVVWDPGRGEVPPASLAGFDAVVHLAGEPIADGRWTPERKRRIRESRVRGTEGIARALAALPSPPEVLIVASAVGIYGDRGAEVLDERSPPGAGFLTKVCEAWEGAAAPARVAGIRVVHLRFGVVLASHGGALARMLLPFRLGAGGVLGDGAHYVGWVALDDVLGAIGHALATRTLAGPVNVVAPMPVTNREYTETLGRVLGRPTVLPVPAAALRLAFGEVADSVLLASTRAVPRALTESGYPFRWPTLDGALRHTLGVARA